MTTKTKTDIVKDLRELADFLERRTIITGRVTMPTVYLFARDADEFAQSISMIGGFEKKVDDYAMKAVKMFGDVKLMVHVQRSEMCEKIVVGTKQVELTREVYPEGVTPTTVTETVDEDITEWSCPPAWRQI
jgi:hypothetical protein